MRRVLLIDPVAPVRMHLAQRLRRLGWTVTEASGLAEATAATRRPPELVVTELHLADAQGVEIVRRLRQAFPGVAVVVCSAAAKGELAVAAWRAGAADFLVKPVRPERLGRCLEALGRDVRAAEER
ncbi:MAG TPA: response regulator [Bacillota bacterium]